MEKRTCPVCGEQIKGRIDKVFCSVNCKSLYQYEKVREEEKFFFQVDAQLKTNRKILKLFNKTGKTTLRREVLHAKGFNPNFFTHYWKNDQGQVYFFCYDFGFLKIEENAAKGIKRKYLIVQWQEYMSRSVSTS